MEECPRCKKRMQEATDNESEPEKRFYCWGCEVMVKIFPNGMKIAIDFDEKYPNHTFG